MESQFNDTVNISESMEPGFDPQDIGQRASMMLSRPYNILIIALGVISIVANIIGLLGITQVKGGSSPRLRLIISLGCSDILCGLSNLLYIIVRIFQPHSSYLDPTWCYVIFTKILLYIAYNASLLNLLGMAIDHYLAIMRPLHYTALMTKNKATIMISVFWVISVILGFSDLIFSFIDYHEAKHVYGYCFYSKVTQYQAPFALYFLALVCMVTMLYVYLRIYREVCKHQRRAPPNSEFHRNKKGLVTTLLILGTFFGCWLPTAVTEIIPFVVVYASPELIKHLGQLPTAQLYLQVLPIINAICDPIIYMTRTAEIRQSCQYWTSSWKGKGRKRSSSVMEANGTSYAMVSNGRDRCFSNASFSRNTMETST